MVFFLSATFLLLAHALPLFVLRVRARRRGEDDVFAPVVFLSGLGIMGIPYLYLIAADHAYLWPDLRYSPWVTDLDGVVVRYSLYTAAVLYCTLAGAYSPVARAVAARIPRLAQERFTPARCNRALLFAGAAGVAMYLYFIRSVGGLLYLWTHLYLRTRLAGGLGYLGIAYMLLLTFAGLLAVNRLRYRQTRLGAAFAMLAVFMVGVLLASTGGRSPTLHVFVAAILLHHYAVRRKPRLLTPGTAALGVLVFAFIVILPLFRTSGAYDKYAQTPTLMLDDGLNTLALMAPQVSGFDRAAIMLEYFDTGRLWAGRSYLDLAYAPVPRTMYPRKPPVDDGVYFRAIMEGHRVVPSVPARDMQPTSWPMGTNVAYMNFGLPGALLAFFLVGVALGASYHYMRLSGYTVFSVFLYEFMVMGGGLSFSVYGIVLFVMNVGLATAFFWVFFGRRSWPRPAPLATPAPAALAAPAA